MPLDQDTRNRLQRFVTDARELLTNEFTRQMQQDYGMDPEAALQLITGNTAEILGISDRYGTLEEGKSATLFISEGDALDMRTNQLTHAFIDGRELSLETHQTELWKRYSGKYESE